MMMITPSFTSTWPICICIIAPLGLFRVGELGICKFLRTLCNKELKLYV